MSYTFNTQHGKGKDAERFIYEVFQPAFNVIPASKDLQEQGIDFTFTDRANNQVHKVELKTDWTADRTGNAFIETISCDREGKLGWAYTSQSSWLLYFIPQKKRIYRIAFELLILELSGWQCYPEREIPNRGKGGNYNTIGLLVPLAELERVSQEVIEL
jgi:hypothetical protein